MKKSCFHPYFRLLHERKWSLMSAKTREDARGLLEREALERGKLSENLIMSWIFTGEKCLRMLY